MSLTPDPVESYAYHRLALTDPRSRWWKPLVEILLVLVLFLMASAVAGLLWFVVGRATGRAASTAMTTSGYPKDLLTDPVSLFFTFFSLTLLIPVVLLVRAMLGPHPLGLVFSVAARMRWGWLGCCAAVSLVLYGGVQAVLQAVSATVSAPPSVHWTGTTAILVVLVVVLVPIQSFAEELAFRGMLMQAVGRWLRHPLWAVLLPVPVFVLGHGYDGWGLASIAVMAVLAGVLCVRTGGLEASTGMHLGNNVIGLLFGVLGWSDPTADGGSSATSAVFSLVMDGAYTLVVLWLARRRSIHRVRTVREPSPAVPTTPRSIA